MAHKRSPRARVARQVRLEVHRETIDILATRHQPVDPLRSRYPEVLTAPDGTGQFSPRAGDREKLGSYHWRNLHKNLARPRFRTRNTQSKDKVTYVRSD